MNTIQQVTFFKDYAASELSTADMTLQELRTLVLKTTASEKGQLPWLKLATFGDKKSENYSLRHNANVKAISGIELDYDREKMSFDDAVAIIKLTRLQALIYTSPSHTVEKPRWRIVLPTSCALPGGAREKLVARVNGLFDGAFADESFVLSQAYYFGSVNGNPDHRAEIVNGDFIDLRSDLDVGARGKMNGATWDGKPRTPGENPEANPDLIYLAMTVIPNDDVSREQWNNTGMAIWHATAGHERGLEAFAMWSQKSKKCRSKSRQGGYKERWNHYFDSPPTKIGAGSIIKWANEASPGWDREYLRNLEERAFAPSDEATKRQQIGWLKKNVWDKRPNAKASNAKKSKASVKSREPEPEKQEAKTHSGLNIVRVADVEAKKVDWLWPGRIARGKLTILAGMPDVNKSTMTLDLTARVTTGEMLPAGGGRAPLGSVIILSAEDDVADTVRPRLEVAGADLARVHVITAIKAANGVGPRSFDLSQDIGRLEKVIAEIGDVLLVIIDPISSYMGKPGKLDSYRSTDVRATLAPLQEMAARCGASVIGIDHLNKSGGAQAMMRVLGSVAFVAAARAVYVVVRDDEDGERRLMLPAKNNLGKMRTGLAFRVFEKLAPAPVFDAYPAIKWEDEPVTMTADEALANKHDGRKSEAAEAAKTLIAEMLAEKPMKQKDIEKRAEEQQISHRSLTTAKKAMGVVSKKVNAAWWWSLPGREGPM